MSDLNLQKFLRDPLNGPDPFAKLVEEFGVYSKKHPLYPNLVQFQYDQIEASKCKTHPIVVESRGIILDKDDNWNVVCRSFDRFFNHGEIDTPIDWGTARVQEKVDGSLMTMYWYNRHWNVCTKGSPDAGGTVGAQEFTFRDLFWTTFDYTFPGRKNDFIPGCTYIFELTSIHNRVVTAQVGNNGKLTLIGMREMYGNEVNIEPFIDFFPIVATFPLNSMTDVIEAAQDLNPSQQEGFIVVDRNFQRLKIKSPNYVLLHYLKDTLNDERIVKLLKTGESSEVLAYFPDLKFRYDEITAQYQDLIEYVDALYTQIIEGVDFPTPKDFALFVQKNVSKELQNYFYQRRRKTIAGGKEWLGKMIDKNVVALLCRDTYE